MEKQKLLILLLFLLAVGAAACLQFLGGPPEGPGSAGRRRAAPPRVGEFRGIAMQLHSGAPDHPYATYVEEIAEQGANTIYFVVTAFQENASSTSIFIDRRKSPDDRKLRSLIKLAHARKLRVVLAPFVLLENARKGEWRGQLAPTNWDDWWDDYEQVVGHYARLAHAANAEVYVVGSELVTTEKYTARWRGLISRVRKIYKGLLCYSANWDHYDPIKWWDDLDMIGMTTYYDLTAGKEPTLPRLLAKWASIKKKVLHWRAGAHPNRRILFTEVGWPNQVTCAEYPWNYYSAPDKPAPEAQANCFKAFFQTWADEEAVAGFLVWEWRNSPGQTGGPRDSSYIPCGKPAMEVIRKYLRPSGWRRGVPPATAPVRRQPPADRGGQ